MTMSDVKDISFVQAYYPWCGEIHGIKTLSRNLINIFLEI